MTESNNNFGNFNNTEPLIGNQSWDYGSAMDFSAAGKANLTFNTKIDDVSPAYRQA